MEKLLTAFAAFVAKINAMITDYSAADVKLAQAIEKLRVKKAEQSQVDGLATTVTNVVSTVNQVSTAVNAANTNATNALNVANQANATATAVDAKATTALSTANSADAKAESAITSVNGVSQQLAVLQQFVKDASVNEFYYESVTADLVDIQNLLTEKATELGANVVDKQYSVNVVGGSSFGYADANGDMVILELPNGGRLVPTISNGVVVSAFVVPTAEGGLVIPDIDTTTNATTTTTTVDGILSNPYYL